MKHRIIWWFIEQIPFPWLLRKLLYLQDIFKNFYDRDFLSFTFFKLRIVTFLALTAKL